MPWHDILLLALIIRKPKLLPQGPLLLGLSLIVSLNLPRQVHILLPVVLQHVLDFPVDLLFFLRFLSLTPI